VVHLQIFDNIDYDLLTIGNHELYVSDVAYEHFYNFSRYWGDKYLTSSVQIYNTASQEFEYIGHQYRYFTTTNGLRIMAFGVLYDFNGNSNVSNVIPAAQVVNQTWWKSAITGYPDNCETQVTIDLFVLIGHNPVRWNDSESTLEIYYKSIRSAQPNVPIQVFGGHSHIRDFAVYDEMTTALESGRYCETVGWFSMTGLKSSNYTGAAAPSGVPNQTQLALSNKTTNDPNATNVGASLKYSRRYLDWNRVTMEYHATGSQNPANSSFDYYRGIQVTNNITATRKKLNLNTTLGCAPETWCISCAPYGTEGNIYSGLLPKTLAGGVVNQTRADIPRIIIIVNSGGIRFDLVQRPFSVDGKSAGSSCSRRRLRLHCNR
jgi:2',3'-cyclic-nucleotide 2'-phosphodiesterase (5'-nucleotidase family)